MILVDKVQKIKSVFSIGDFRHNIVNSEEAKKFMNEVKQVPKNMLGWNDFTVYNPKVKRDTSFVPKYVQKDSEQKNTIINKMKNSLELK